MTTMNQANFDILWSRVDKLDGGYKPTWTESPAGTTVVVPFSTLQAAIAGNGVITGDHGGKWRLVANATRGNQIEYTTLDGVSTIDPATEQVAKMVRGADHNIWQQAQASGLWWYTADVCPPVWGPQGGSTIGPSMSTTPPVVTPPPTGTLVSDSKGIPGKPISWLRRAMGPNIYENGQDGAGANASAAAHIRALTYLGGDASADFTCRQYTENAAKQVAFSDAIAAAMPNVKHNFCLTWPGSLAVLKDIMSQSKTNNRKWFGRAEGPNEANGYPGFGWGTLTPQTCLDWMRDLFAFANTMGIEVIGPSISLPTTLQQYFGTLMQGIADNCHLGNFHDYPNHGCFATELRQRTIDAWSIFKKPQGVLSEVGAQIYQQGVMPDDTTAAYYTGIGWIKSHWSFNTVAFQPWCLYDYQGNWSAPTGLFRGFDPGNPKPVATLIRAINILCADNAPNRFTINPGMLDISFSGMPTGKNQDAGGQYAVYRNSDGTWNVFVWDEQDTRDGLTKTVSVTLGSPKSKVVDYALTGINRTIIERPLPLRTLTPAPSTFNLDLGKEIRLLKISP